MSSFAYLHSKKKVDFYHSLPVRRETLFAVSFVNGILIMAAVYLVNLLIAMAVMAANGMSPGMFVGAGFKAFGFHMVYYLLMYATTVLAMMLTGNVILGILMNVILNAWGPWRFCWPAAALHRFSEPITMPAKTPWRTPYSMPPLWPSI